MLAARGSLPYRHRGVRHESSADGWRLMDITHLPLSDGHYGYGGYQARSSGAYVLTLPTSKAVVASRLNVTPEHFSRILHDLSERGLIAVEGREIRIVDSAKLRDYHA